MYANSFSGNYGLLEGGEDMKGMLLVNVLYPKIIHNEDKDHRSLFVVPES